MNTVLAAILALSQDERKPDHVGRVVGTAKDGKNLVLTIETSALAEISIQLTEETRISYVGVEERPTIGHIASIWLQAGSKDTAARVTFAGTVEKVEKKREPEKRTILSGRVRRVVKEGEVTIVTLSKDGGDVSFKVTPRTEGGGGIAEGQTVVAWLDPASPDVATIVKLQPAKGEERKPDLAGEVLELSEVDAGLKVVLKVASEKEEKTSRAAFIITKKTKTTYVGLRDGEEDEPRIGFRAAVWFAEGTQERAGLVRFEAARRRDPDFKGEVIGLFKEGDEIKVTLERGKFVITKKTLVVYTGDTKRPALGVIALAWVQEGVAVEVRFMSGRSEEK